MEITNKSNCEESTIWKLMNEITKLKQENEQLKVDNKLLNNKLLHNGNELNYNTNNNVTTDSSMLNEYEDKYLAGCENDEDFYAYAEAYNNCSLPPEV